MKTMANLLVCEGCGADLKGVNGYVRCIGIEYSYDSPDHYDGISEYCCPDCGRREGRWTGKVLRDGESEPLFGKTRREAL